MQIPLSSRFKLTVRGSFFGFFMKRYGNLYSEIIDSDNLIKAYKAASKAKRSKNAYQKFTINLFDELKALHTELSSETYQPMGYYKFMVHEPKTRLIHAPRFRDVVVQHAIYNIIYKLFDGRFIHDTYACRVGKGTHKCSLRALDMLRNSPDDSYILKMDYKKYFYSINHDDLYREISKVIKCKKTINLIRKFFGEDEKGIPIGSVISQLFANIYLNPVDHFIKRELKCKNYCRYMDDLIIVGITKEEANRFRTLIGEFSNDKLHLEFSKTSIATVKNGINFVGYRTWKWGRLVRKHALKNFNKFLKNKDATRLATMLGHAKNTISYNHFISKISKSSLSV